MNTTAEPLAAQVLWLTVRRTKENGRTARDLHVWCADGTALLTARAYNWGRDLMVYRLRAAPAAPVPFVLLRRRRLFPLTGVVDILDPAAGDRIGSVRRNGGFRSAEGNVAGRFRDARTSRGRAGEAVLAAVVDTVMSGGGGSEVSAARAFTCAVNGEHAGSLAPAVLPFEIEPTAEPAAAVRMLQRVLPQWLSLRLTLPRASRGWKLEWHHAAPGCDLRVTLAATLFTLEMHHWG
jgi:hypothetical protein